MLAGRGRTNCDAKICGWMNHYNYWTIEYSHWQSDQSDDCTRHGGPQLKDASDIKLPNARIIYSRHAKPVEGQPSVLVLAKGGR